MTPQDVIAKMAEAAFDHEVDAAAFVYRNWLDPNPPKKMTWGELDGNTKSFRVSYMRAALAEAERQGWVMVEEKQLAETVETLEDALNYVSEYFREKWKYDDVAKAARSMLAAAPKL